MPSARILTRDPWFSDRRRPQSEVRSLLRLIFCGGSSVVFQTFVGIASNQGTTARLDAMRKDAEHVIGLCQVFQDLSKTCQPRPTQISLYKMIQSFRIRVEILFYHHQASITLINPLQPSPSLLQSLVLLVNQSLLYYNIYFTTTFLSTITKQQKPQQQTSFNPSK
jgi:hypothetical protein